MTAICGIFQWDGRRDAAQSCARMQRALAPYGPDRAAIWDGGEGALGLGLARFLPEDVFDRQPLVGGGGRWRLVADARLDNRAELRADLGISAQEAGELADSDLILRAWERWQEATPERLVGDFALAVWDEHARNIHLTRDYLGQRPLFYHENRRYSAFSSMPRGLHALDDIPRAPDLDRIRDYLALAPMRGERSFFAGISRVEPGEHVVLRAGGGVTRALWYGWGQGKEVRFARDEEYVEAFRAIFDRAVEDRLRARVPIASQLSGGLDSTAVTATAARLLAAKGQRLTAYTHVPLKGVPLAEADTRTGDEWPLARALADLYPNIAHLPVEAAERVLGGDLEAQVHYFEYPALNLCNLVWMREISRLAGRGGRSVLLSGMMGNATISLAGLERLTELVLAGHWRLWRGECEALRVKGFGRVWPVWRALGPLLPPQLYALLRHVAGRDDDRLETYSALKDEVRTSAAFRAHMAAVGVDPSFRPARSVRAFSQFVLRRLDIFGQEQKGQVAAFGVDSRDPTADRRVVEFVQAVPSDLFLRNGESKWLYHRAFADRVPEAVRAARRKGLQAADWHERFRRDQPELRSAFALAAGMPAVRSLLAADSLTEVLNRHLPAGPPDAQVTLSVRLRLLRGLSVAHFLHRMDRGNAGNAEI